MPFVARLAASLDELPPSGAPVTSVGIDQASDLNCWESQIRGTALLSRNQVEADGQGDGPESFQSIPPSTSGGDKAPARLFLITEHAPIPGRSGGGLFSNEGRLLGLCVGRIEVKSSRGTSGAIGLFASGQSIQRVLDQLDRPEPH